LIADDNNNKVDEDLSSDTDSICEAAVVCEPAHGQSHQSPKNESACKAVENQGMLIICKFDYVYRSLRVIYFLKTNSEI
jgi:hypothetical protein